MPKFIDNRLSYLETITRVYKSKFLNCDQNTGLINLKVWLKIGCVAVKCR